MDVLQFFLQKASVALTRTYMCNVTQRSLPSPMNLMSLIIKILKSHQCWKYIHTYIHHVYTHTGIRTFFSVQKQVCLFCCYQQLLLPGFLFSWPFITGAGVYPRADISTSTHQVSTVLSPMTLLQQMVQMAWHIHSDSLQKPNCQTADQFGKKGRKLLLKKNYYELSFMW